MTPPFVNARIMAMTFIAAVHAQSPIVLSSPQSQTTDSDRAEFNKRLAVWREYVNRRFQELPTSRRLSSNLPEREEILYNNQAYRDLIALGAPAIPFLVEEVQHSSSLASALIDITKWRARLAKEGDTRVRPTVYVEEFPDLRGQTYIATGRYWTYWWETGRKKIPQVFERFHKEWQDKKKAGDEAGAKDRYQRMIDLGIVALPCMVAKVQAGDKELIPAIAELSDKAIAKDATPEAVQTWWAKKKPELRILLESDATSRPSK
jgi:hypothetical protein